MSGSELEAALRSLARICDAGRRSGWPSPNAWSNSDAWQSAYMALAVRIRDGRVDVTRPLHALARRTARNFFLDECRRQRRLTAIGSEQIERWGAGAGRPPEESAEALRQGEALRGGLIGLIERGKLNETDLLVLIRRYVDEWSADEVAGATGLGAENVRQICTRRRRLLRSEFADMELEETAG